MSPSKLPRISFLVALALSAGAASCPPRLPDDPSASALSSGQATVVLGSSCARDLALGYQACQMERGKPLPHLQIMFMNPGDYFVSDCQFGTLKNGSVTGPGVVEVELQPIDMFLANNTFCLLKIEAIERYPDNGDPHQFHSVAMSGGFFIEQFPPGYMPVPPPDTVAWKCVVERTVKGRTTVRCN